MAGSPRVRAATLELDTRARDMRANGVDGATELDYVCDWIANGGTINSLVKELNTYATVDIERSQVMTALYKLFGKPEVTRRLSEARPEGAYALVDQAIEIVDNLNDRGALLTREDVARAKAQAEIRQWTAEKFNPKELGSAKSASVTINVGSLHLDALRARQSLPSASIEVHALPASVEAGVAAEEVTDG